MKKTFVIGDVQGCFSQFQKLIDKIGRNHIVQLWLTGDLVNRGPNSLEMLRWCVSNRHWIRVVLGNHDLHLLAVSAGIRDARPDDTIDAVLKAPDCENLLTWLRQQPLAYLAQGHLMVHAGLLPQWSAMHALELSCEVSTALRSANWKDFLSSMYGDQPDAWNPSLRGADRSRVIVNAMTRLRFCSENGSMEFDTKEGSKAAPDGYLPWLRIANRSAENTKIVFGHWSTLGLTNEPNLLGIDTGCVWGGKLTAAEITNSPHRTIVQIAGPNSLTSR
jgi:bis(5'-nucleosyl)-tetraphosphatase (symmetrical)